MSSVIKRRRTFKKKRLNFRITILIGLPPNLIAGKLQ